ncbi:hypothetical protein ABZ876_12460 [Streptomyces sp. NPDC046931]|uniref:hypothetical protein n=1 Tax=Streptomyces sp. NPDC046931 TaxID=3154806 RepID=UPI0033C3A040
MAQGENLDILAVVAHRQQAHHGEHVRHSQTGQSQQMESPSVVLLVLLSPFSTAARTWFSMCRMTGGGSRTHAW